MESENTGEYKNTFEGYFCNISKNERRAQKSAEI